MCARRCRRSATRPTRRTRSGLAHIVRTGWFRQAHIKSEACYRLRLLLTQRRNLKRKVLDLENTIRHSLKAFGIRFKGTGRGGFDAGGARGGGRRCADQRADGRHADGARGAVEAILPAARSGGEVRRAPRAVPALHGDPGRRAGDGVELRDGDRRSVALPPLA